MECPNCGAEVKANSKCEYCGSFVEKEPDYQKSIEQATEELEDFVKTTFTPEVKRKLTITFCLAGVFLIVILLINFLSFYGILIQPMFKGLVTTYEESDSFYSSNSETVQPDISSLKEARGNISSFDHTGALVITYNGDECTTILKDDTLLEWLSQTERSLENVDVIFSTDSDGNITSLAMSSNTFYILEKQNDNYTILRDGNVFCSTSNIPLEAGSYYDGYFSYPDVNVHAATLHSGNGYSMFDPVCDEKAVRTVSDFYTKEEISLPMIRMGSDWYYCSQQLYDMCTEGANIPASICEDSSMGILYSEK